MDTKQNSYNVILNHYSDKDSFLSEMKSETQLQNTSIPSRCCLTSVPDPKSRVLTYELSEEEAQNLSNDPRIKSIQKINNEIKRVLFHIDIPPVESLDYIGMLSNHEYYGNQYANIDLPDTSDIDIVITDSIVAPNHAEFLESSTPDFPDDNFLQRRVNASTNSRVFQFKNLDNTSQSYTNNNHGTHVAGIAAGKTQGWCRNARIITTSFYDIESNAQEILDWHVSKSGTRPTIMNCSWGFSYYGVAASYVKSIVHRGTTYTKPSLTGVYPNFSSMSKAERVAAITDWCSFFTSKGFCIKQIHTQYANRAYAAYDDELPSGESSVELAYIPAADPAVNDIMDEFIASGIIVVAAAGNSAFECDLPGGIDYDNKVVFNNNFELFYHRGSTPAFIRNETSTTITNNVISVGSLSNHNYKSSFSCCGSGVNVYAPGAGIISSVFDDTVGGAYIDHMSDLAVYNGTSMASPQVCGVLGIVAQNKKSSGENLVTSTINHTVTVATTSAGNKFFIDGVESPALTLYEGNTYVFNLDSSTSNHTFNISTVPDGRVNGTYDSSNNYTQNVTTTTNSIQIIVPVGAPKLYYFCENHNSMGSSMSVYAHPTAGWPSNSNQAQASGLHYITNYSVSNIYDTGFANSGSIISNNIYDGDFGLDRSQNDLAKYSLHGSSNLCIYLDATHLTCGDVLSKPIANLGDIYTGGSGGGSGLDDGSAPPLPDSSGGGSGDIVSTDEDGEGVVISPPASNSTKEYNTVVQNMIDQINENTEKNNTEEEIEIKDKNKWWWL